jgi:hypothetical protein
MYNENDKRDLSKQFEIKLKRKTCDLLSPWEISNFVSKLTNSYYKNELINTVALALNQGINSEDIFVINKSFSIKTKYSYLQKTSILDLNNLTDLKNFYYLGNTISMIPNEKLFNLNCIFDMFRKINEYLGKVGTGKISADRLKIYFDMVKAYDLGKAIEQILLDAKQKIAISEKSREQIKLYIGELDKIYTRINNEIINYKNDKFYIDIIKKSIISNMQLGKEQEEDETYRKIERTHFKRFYNLLNEGLDRPIVGIYHNETNKIQILGSSHMTKDVESSTFLDIKEISHNSPPIVNFFIGINIVIPLMILVNNQIMKLENRKRENRISENDIKIKEKFDAIKEQLTILQQNDEMQAVNEIPMDYLRENMDNLSEQISNKIAQSIKNYNFDNKSMEINVIDFEEKRKEKDREHQRNKRK